MQLTVRSAGQKSTTWPEVHPRASSDSPLEVGAYEDLLFWRRRQLFLLAEVPHGLAGEEARCRFILRAERRCSRASGRGRARLSCSSRQAGQPSRCVDRAVHGGSYTPEPPCKRSRRYRGGNCDRGAGAARFFFGALRVNPITAQLMLTPDAPYGAGFPVAGLTPVSRSGRVAARLKT